MNAARQSPTPTVDAPGDASVGAPGSGPAGGRPANPGDRFPRLSARTRRFTLGEPRNLTIVGDGRTVLFLRSRGGTDPLTCLWAYDVATGGERLLVDPLALLSDPDDLPEAEARRRERARESASGIVGFSTDAAGARVAFALGGQLFVTDVATATTWAPPTAEGVFDPRLSPDGSLVAYVSDGALRAVDARPGATADRELAADPDELITWGLAEFVAAEEMGRSRGFWWSPDGATLAVARVDNSPVAEWWVADASNPAEPPVALRYPAAGTDNASVTLWLVSVVSTDQPRVQVRWDASAYPYLAAVDWAAGHPLVISVQPRSQRSLVVLGVDTATGETAQRWRQDDEHWVELCPGVPRWWGEDLVTLVDRDGARRVVVGGRPLSPTDLQVRAVVGTLGKDLVISASSDDPSEVHLYRVGRGPDGDAEAAVSRLTGEPGVHGGSAAGDTLVVVSSSMAWFGSRVTVRSGIGAAGEIASVAARPPVAPRGRFAVVGARRLPAIVLVPRAAAGIPDGPLPVLVDPYGGPHAQRVVRVRNAHLSSQWFADQGFVVVVVDGRGTPGRGPAWERAVWGDLASPVLDDQVDALQALAARDERLDLTRVGIRGWSFGGYLAALAVLRRPDVFHAAIAGAPVTDWRLYDTHYTERYLGHPDEHPANYLRTSLAEDAHRLTRPLLLIHGLADDNVVAAHTFRLSGALLAHGRPHRVLPLSGVTHMTPQETVAENLLLLQLAFLRDALQMGSSGKRRSSPIG
jgi:dipeptidyl-peptidase-4